MTDFHRSTNELTAREISKNLIDREASLLKMQSDSIIVSIEGSLSERGAMYKHPPKKLPEGFRDIWKAIAQADEAAASRQVLASELRISTHTIQRILVDCSVPDFTKPVSRRILHSWTRTIVRLALHFGHDPLEWVKMVNINPVDRILEVIETEISRKAGIVSTYKDVQTKNPISKGYPDSFSISLLDSESPFFEHLGRKMFNAIAPELKARRDIDTDEMLTNIDTVLEESEPFRGRADGKELMEGKFCRSCLAPLNEEHNAGVSDIYCCYCSDENGCLLPREEVLLIMTEWFMYWQKGLTESEARRRADLYMSSMPAWNVGM